jgi:hypothetical protein
MADSSLDRNHAEMSKKKRKKPKKPQTKPEKPKKTLENLKKDSSRSMPMSVVEWGRNDGRICL